MSDPIVCDVHGESVATYVCTHICDTLQDGVPRGFLWQLNDGEYDAICAACNAMPDEAWEEQASDTLRLLCFECYAKAAELNGITMVRKHS